jgi:tripartite-type tricarboxylate transporter receptor subunit TctC
MQVMFDVVSSSIGHIRAGKLRPLAVTTAARLNILPDVPPVGEFVPGYDAIGWNGLCAPKNTPSEMIGILNRAVNASVADAGFKTRLADLGLVPFANSTAEFAKFVADYTEKWAKVIRTAAIKAE